ncbi:hypothetical protein COLO4_29163 [Corchorus olitorius]|uniref:Uncharacterized protein n=1 Tax=Corchorus olitorius TaxID=93759 RepID=A0A1R3HG28_9ROSI|nr:hypothetical protein COLO4_29163 [Corchorus olitorius]
MMDYIDTKILREIQRKLFLRQLELRLDCIFDRAISNFQRKLNQGLKELSNARVAEVEDASIETEIEESSLDSECTTIAETNINHDASVFTQLQLSPDVTSSKSELIEPIEESQLEEPKVNINLEVERHSKVDEIISENPKATFLRFEEISLQGQHHFKPQAGNVACYFPERIDGLAFKGCKGTLARIIAQKQAITTEHYPEVFIGFRPSGLVRNYLIDFYRKPSLIIHVCKLFDEMPEPDIALRASLVSVHSLIGNIIKTLDMIEESPWRIPHGILYNAIVMRLVTSPLNGIVAFIYGCSLLFEDGKMHLVGVKVEKFMCASIVCGISVGLLQFGKQVKHALSTRGSSERDLCGCSLMIEARKMCYGMNERSGAACNDLLMQYLYGDMLMLGNLVKMKLDEFKDASICGQNFFREPYYELGNHDKLGPAWFMAGGISLILVAKTVKDVIVLIIVIPPAEPKILKSHMLGENNVLGGVPCFILEDKDDFMEGGYMHSVISHFSLKLGKSSSYHILFLVKSYHILKEPRYELDDEQPWNSLWCLEIVVELRKRGIVLGLIAILWKSYTLLTTYGADDLKTIRVKINCADGVDFLTCSLEIEQLSPAYDAIGLILKEPFMGRICGIRNIERKFFLGGSLQMQEQATKKMDSGQTLIKLTNLLSVVLIRTEQGVDSLDHAAKNYFNAVAHDLEAWENLKKISLLSWGYLVKQFTALAAYFQQLVFYQLPFCSYYSHGPILAPSLRTMMLSWKGHCYRKTGSSFSSPKISTGYSSPKRSTSSLVGYNDNVVRAIIVYNTANSLHRLSRGGGSNGGDSDGDTDSYSPEPGPEPANSGENSNSSSIQESMEKKNDEVHLTVPALPDYEPHARV